VSRGVFRDKTHDTVKPPLLVSSFARFRCLITQTLYQNLVRPCWHDTPASRPTFATLVKLIDEHLAIALALMPAAKARKSRVSTPAARKGSAAPRFSVVSQAHSDRMISFQRQGRMNSGLTLAPPSEPAVSSDPTGRYSARPSHGSMLASSILSASTSRLESQDGISPYLQEDAHTAAPISLSSDPISRYSAHPSLFSLAPSSALSASMSHLTSAGFQGDSSGYLREDAIQDGTPVFSRDGSNTSDFWRQQTDLLMASSASAPHLSVPTLVVTAPPVSTDTSPLPTAEPSAPTATLIDFSTGHSKASATISLPDDSSRKLHPAPRDSLADLAATSTSRSQPMATGTAYLQIGESVSVKRPPLTKSVRTICDPEPGESVVMETSLGNPFSLYEASELHDSVS
jgi:hypothetical protein